MNNPSIFPWNSSPVSAEICKSIYPVSSIEKKGSFTYQTSNDFGKKNKTILISANQEMIFSCISTDIQAIGDIEDFEVTFFGAKDHYGRDIDHYGRDIKLRNTEEKIILRPLYCGKDITETAYSCYCKQTGQTKDHVKSFSTNPTLRFHVGTVARQKLNKFTPIGLPPSEKVQDSRIYFEGGNTFFICNRKEKPIFLIGKDLLTFTHLALWLDEFFNSVDFQAEDPCGSYSREIFLFLQNKLKSDPKLKKLLEKNLKIKKLFITGWTNNENGQQAMKELQGLILSSLEVNSIPLPFSPWLTTGKPVDEINAQFLNNDIYKNITREAEHLMQTASDKTINRGIGDLQAMGLIPSKKQACDYLAQRKFVKDELFPKELHIEREKIIFLPQLAYHLDLMMAPGPNGSIFIPDFEQITLVLNQIQVRASDLELTALDLEILDLYLSEAAKISSELKRLLKKTKKKLEEKDFTIIPSPGIFLTRYATEKKPYAINFFNCVTGYSDKTEHFYYICSGNCVGDRLGRVLMDIYADFLKQQIPGIAVYFVGKTDGRQPDFLFPNEVTNLGYAGVHCMTFELETEKKTIG